MEKNRKFHIAGIEPESVVDGDGIRMTIFFQGCSHHCPGCQNPATWDPKKPVKEMSPQEIFDQYKEDPLLDGVTLSGGEPFEQDPKLLETLMIYIHSLGGTVWVYTGYDQKSFFHQNIEIEQSKIWKNVMSEIDYLVDGPFIKEQRDLSLVFRGSRNQRIWKMVIEDEPKFIDVTEQFDNKSI